MPQPREGAAPPLTAVGIPAIVLLAVVTASQLLERYINRVWRPDLSEWEWISEVFVIVAFAVMTMLWSRLRLARTAIASLERERLTIQAELGVAANVQRALLPPIPETMHGITWHAVMEPAGKVGGDYYDFFPLTDDRMCVVLADVSGKGVPAAVFVSNARAVLRAVARSGSAPGQILAEVSDTLLQDSGGALYVTCVVAIVDTVRHTVTYANAGHPPGLVLAASGSTRVLAVGGPPLGLLPAARYDEELITLEAGDLVVLVSDGITDAIDVGGNGIPSAIRDRLVNLRQRTPADACTALLRAARASTGPAGVAQWADDRTVVAFNLSPVPPATGRG